jgi:anti-sigma B factor antagonist
MRAMWRRDTAVVATIADTLDRSRGPLRLCLVDDLDAPAPALSVVTLLAPAAPGRPAPDVVVAIGGEVDIVTAARVRAELRLAQALSPGRLILDLAGVTFLDAAGISAILSPCRRGEVRVTLVAPPGRVRRLLQIVGADRAVDILEARPEADAGAEPPELPTAA